jgi:iron complex transport system permease protein
LKSAAKEENTQLQANLQEKQAFNFKTHHQFFLSSRTFLLLALIFFAFFSILFCASLGPVHIPFQKVRRIFFHPMLAKGIAREILFEIRLPRILLGFLVGGALACAGAGLQGALRNPLADPYIVGTSSGSAFGAALCFLLKLNNSHFLPLFAFVGAFLSILSVLALSQKGGKFPVVRVLLAGVAVGSFVWAFVTFLLTLSGENLQKVVFWLLGSLANRSWSDVKLIFPYAIFGTLVLWAFAYPLNLLTLGEERAESLGISPEKVKLVILLISSLLTASSVAVSGLIGFLGLVVPHGARMAFGPDHRVLIPASFLAGGMLLVWADAFARLVVEPAELPVGVVTALLGAPFFLYLLRKKE